MRRLNTKALFALFASLMLAVAIGACGDDDDDGGGGGGGEASLDLVIGDSIPLTGDLAPFGPPGQKAADMAVDQINQAVQEAGVDHTVEVVHEDNETNPQAAVQAARKLVESDGASCLIGAWASADTIPTAQSVAIPESVLLISPASTADEITDLDDNGLVNRSVLPDKFQGPTLAQAISEDLGGAEGKTVNIGARNDAYGTGLAGTFTDGWEGLGGQIGQEVIYDPEQPSYNSEANQIVSGNPDAIVIIDFPEPFDKVGPALTRTGNFDPKIAWGTDGLFDTATAEAQPDLEGMRGTFPGVPEGRPASEAFEKLFPQSEPRDVTTPLFGTQQNFDAVVLCYLAAVAAGSTDGQEMADALPDLTRPPGDKFTWQQLPEAIEAVQNGDDIDYVGASGEIEMTDDGDSTAEVYDIYTYQGGDAPITGEIPVVLPEE